MKIKTFILTFLIMSCPFLFGQQHFDPDVPTGYETEKTITAKIVLDGETLKDASYEIATYVGDKCEGVSTIDAETDLPNGMDDVYYTSIVVHGDNNTGNIHFRLWNGTNEYVSLNKIPFNGSEWTADEELGSLADLYVINFKSVAQIEGTEFDVVYPSLQEAIDACKEGDNTIELLADNAEDVTIKQVEGVNVTIDGGTSRYDYSGTITIHGNARYQGEETLTFKNIDFTTNEAGHYFIDSNSTASAERYAHNVTVKDCNFTATDAGVNSAVAMRIRQGFDIAINGGTFTNLHSALQAYGNAGITVSDITLIGKNGISAGTSTGVVIKNSNITATGYGVRADGSGAYEMTLTDNTISAELPVVVRKATGDYKLKVDGGSYTASNDEGYDVVFTNGDDGTYEAPTGVFQLTIVEDTELNVFPVYVAKIGTKGYQSLAEAIAAVGDGEVVIELLADVTFDYNARDAYGTTGTTSLIINGNGKTLTLNQKNSDWSSFGLANADAKVVFNNMTIEKTGYGDTSGAWNTHAIIFSSKVEMTNVTVNNSMAVQNGATLTNVTINEANGYYGLWINGNGQSVTMNGGSITATNGGRGIKIADQYINAPASVTLNVTGTTFNTAKKAAVLVSSKAGAVITASNVDITNVAADNANFAWVDEDWAAHYGKVTVEGGDLGQENLPSFAAALMNSDKVEGYYETLPEAVAAAQDGNTITMLKNDNVTATVEVNNNITIDLNGKTVTANCKKAFEVYANATIKNGAIEAAQRCVDTRKAVKLTLTDVTLIADEYTTHGNPQPLTIAGSENGTKVVMTNVNISAAAGYGIITFVETELTANESVISGYSALYVKPGSDNSEFKFVKSDLSGSTIGNDVEGNSFSTIAVRANNVAVNVDAESTVTANGDHCYAISFKSSSQNEAATGSSVTVAGVITGNILDAAPNGNTVKVKAEYADELLAEGYATTEADADGLVKVSGPAVAKIGETYYATLDEAFAAAQNGNEVKILVAGTYALTTSGKNITITGAVDGVVFDNIGAKNMGSANVTFNKVTFDYYPNVNYTGLQHSGNLVYNDCTINGQVFLYGTSETFNNCTFNQNSADAYNVWTYGAKEVAFNECTFNSAGKSVLIYSEDENLFNDVAVTKCTFKATSSVDGKAAIEMDSSSTRGIKLTIDGETTATGFGSGNVSNNSLWNNKKGNNDMANNDITVVVNNVTVLKPWAPVAKIGETPYETLAKAISAATAGQTITICSDVNENVTINKNLTIDGGDNNYTGTMTANAGLTVTVQNIDFVGGGFDKSTKSTTGNYTIKNCTFEDDGDYAYPVRFKGANSVTIEDCTVKNYKYSFLYITSGTNSVSVKNVTVEDCPNYAVYFASGVNSAIIENLTVKNSDNGFVINNTANRALTLKNCKLENVGTAVAEANGTNTITCTLLGTNDFGTSASSQYAKYVLAEADATLTAPDGYNVTTSVVNYLVKHENGVYVVKPAVAKIGETYYETLTEAINAADDGATIQLLPVTINEYVAPWITDTQHTSEKSITIVGSKDDEGKLATTLTAGMYLGYDDSQCREHTIVVEDVKFEGKGLKVACQQNVTIEGNQFNDITEGQAIAVVGKNINSVVKDNVIDNVAAAQGIELRNTLTATVEGNTISNTGHNALQITSQVGATASEINVINNTMSNWGKGGEGRAMRINNIVTANINDNVMTHAAAPEEFIKVTGSTTLDASENYWNGVSPLTDGMFTGVEGDLVPVLKSYYTDAEKQNLVVLSPSVAKIGEEYYPSLAAAVSAAQQGKTIVLLADITEDVTVDKSLTIDGKAEGASANSKYTGKMTVNTSLNINIRNIDFVKGYIDELGGAHGYFTIVNCNFDGVDKSIGYAVTVRGGDELTIENSTAKNYDYGMVYIPSAVANIAIKDVEVSNVAAAFNISYSGDGTFENVKVVENVTYGIHFQIYGSRTYTVKNCDLKGATNPFRFWDKSNNTAKVTVVFEGNNDLGTKGITVNAGELQLATDATLTAAEGLNIKATEEGYVVEYNEGVYSVVPGNIALERNGEIVKKFATIQDAIDAAAENNDKIVVLKDVDLSTNECVLLDNSYNTYFKVEGKTVTVDLNGMTISGEYASSPMLVGVFSTDNNGHLTLEDSSDGKTGAVNVTTAEGYTVYSLIANYEPGCSITINGGTYTLDKAHDSHIYSGSTNDGTQGVTVNGGTFKLENVGTGLNGKPWMFNVLGSNDRNVVVKGGTFDADINHQFWAKEVYVPETLALQNNGNGTWTVVASVAYVEETATSTGSTARKVGYATIEDAIEAIGIRNTNKTVTMLKNVVLENTITIAVGEDVILDLNGKVVSYESAVVGEDMITNKGKLTIESSVEGGKLTYKNTDETGENVTISTISTEPGSELIINGGIIENTSLANNTSNVLVPYTIDILTNGNLGDVTVTINGGSIISENYIAIRQFVNGNVCNNSLTVKGGSITAKKRAINVQDAQGGGQVKNCAKLHVEKGEITATEDGGYSICNFANSENISVIGGTFVGAVYSAVNGIISGGTFDAEPYYAYCAEGFAAVNNGDGTWTVMPVQEQSLVKGWNWYSTYLDIETADLTSAMGSNGDEIKDQDGGKTLYISQLNKWSGSLVIDLSKMYMINVLEACSLKVAADVVDATSYEIKLRKGWSWIGYPSNQEIDINTALANFTEPNEGDRIKSQYNGYAEYRWGEWRGSLKTLVPGIGYMYNNKTETVKSFRYNFTPVTTSRGTVEANVTAENNYWTPNATKYPFNMTMTAVVDGLTDANYEVAAFVNGEVRGSARPIYVEPMDAYVLFLTIHGEDVEEMSFRLYDIDNDTEYDLSDRINYSNNAEVGSLDNPYTFSRGTTGIGEASMSEVNIYPNPTTTGTEINLEATCDKVEVFNALGVKVAEYQNVDTIDALETAGIYVIRITNNGNVQNCRLVVK